MFVGVYKNPGPEFFLCMPSTPGVSLLKYFISNFLHTIFNCMAYNESLAARVEQILDERKTKHTSKKMFGGLCYLVDDKMLMGVEKDRLMVRIDPEDEAAAMKKKGTKP